MSYFRLLGKSFHFPELNNSINRAASPLELFFDLVFVAIFNEISHLLHNLNVPNFFLAGALFFSTFLVWININFYMMRLYSATYIIRIGIAAVMLPLIFLAYPKDYVGTGYIYIISLSFLFSRLFLILLWYVSVIKNPKIENRDFVQSLKYDLESFLLSSLISLIPIILPSKFTLIVALMVSMIVELFYTKYCYRYDSSRKFLTKIPKVDLELIKERNLLFVILIFGEGVISSVSTKGMMESHNLVGGVIFPILIFLTVYLFFLRVYEEIITTIKFEEYNKAKQLYYAATSFNILLLYTLMEQIGSRKVVGWNQKILLILSLSTIIVLHFRKNIATQIGNFNKGISSLFYYCDNWMLVLMSIVVVFILYSTQTITILILLFVYFFLHVLALPYRFSEFETKYK